MQDGQYYDLLKTIKLNKIMENKSNTLMTNVENITIGKETLGLIRCRAMLSNVFNEVFYILNEHYYEQTTDELTEKFRKKHSDLDDELMKLIMLLIEENSMMSDYKEI